ncbi:hypothetical protein Pelo_18791 [Pelomyxa schiedti]|nr:hypothetical protein Pelo_18791 [Pelomyxa schiedti]
MKLLPGQVTGPISSLKESFVNCAKLLRPFTVGIQDFILQHPPLHPDSCDHRFRFVLLGDHRAGKKELMQCFVRHSFNNTENPVFVRQFAQCNGKIIQLQVWKASPVLPGIHKRHFYIKASMVMICFDLSERRSFDNLIHWFDEVGFNFTEETLIVLVGMKSDLPGRAATAKEIAFLCTEMREHIRFLHEIVYVEASSLTGYNVDLVFKVATHIAMQPIITLIIITSTDSGPFCGVVLVVTVVNSWRSKCREQHPREQEHQGQ